MSYKFEKLEVAEEREMSYKFEKLEVWQLAMEYVDQIYAIADQLPASEVYNLRSQITRAATSVALNVAEGSTSQSDLPASDQSPPVPEGYNAPARGLSVQ